MSAYDRIAYGPDLKQETYYIEGKGWRTHHVISNTSSFEREATEEEIAAASTPNKSADLVAEKPAKKPGRPKKGA